MIKSMTAFARLEKIKDKPNITIEIRSYNSRHLDIALRIPHGCLPLEDKIKGLVSERIVRGRIEIAVQIRENSDETYEFEINEATAAAYHKALVQLKERFNIGTEISLDLLAGASGIIKPAELERDLETLWRIIKDGMIEALNDLDEMRAKEGSFIGRDFSKRLDYIEQCIDQIEKNTGDLLLYYQDRLKERIAVLTNGMIEIDSGRIAQEAAHIADKSDISEEIVRVQSHIKQFREIMSSDEPGGRKLNFLLQEFNREFNTMGAKAASVNVSHIIVEVKSELEKLREQVQNVE
ncbi:MAG: YicC family protein [Deltaproteobacteria bacterium]|nr:YicC family protein [Deltaproteobacteria bacterium]MBW2200829.1 YicC family protein [Deltaproteobacteria bacterium]MBW2538382.1 YicC family protein [Deltaproteobacteria bacterium]